MKIKEYMLKSKKQMKVLFVASELTPIAKAGGLGDVVGSLPKALVEGFNTDVRIIIPKYKFLNLEQYAAREIIHSLQIKMQDNKYRKIDVFKLFLPGTDIPVYLIDMPDVFVGNDIYSHDVQGREKNMHFIIFSRAVLELIKAMDWSPDIIHVHDWMMGMICKWLKTVYKNDVFYKNVATVLTIHNIAYQGNMNYSKPSLLGLRKSDFKDFYKLTKRKEINISGEAILSSDMVNTVSLTYAKEVLTKKFGAGLENLLKNKKKQFSGILNGIDYTSFDPRTNEDTPVKYWIDNLDKKVENKLYLQRKLGLTQSAETPLICVISRLATQKGLELVDEVLEELVDMGAQFVVLGSGQKSIEKVFIKAEKEHPKEIAAEIGFDANFAQTIYAGADMILMPSRFEPCGLSQIIAMRFGTVPIVRSTGGLADTVKDDVTGFVFHHYDKHAFLWAIRRAVDVYYNQKEHWKNMQIAGMKKDFSWKKSAKKYIWLYKKAIKNHKNKLNEDSK